MTSEIFLLVLVVILALVAGFLIAVLLELRKTAREVSKFLGTVESTIKPTMAEMNETLKSLRGTTDGINAVVKDVRSFSSSLEDLAQNVGAVNKMIAEIPVQVSGIKVGIRAGLEALVKNLFKRVR